MLKKYIQKIMLIQALALVVGVHVMLVQPVLASASPMQGPAPTIAASTCVSDECKNLYTKYLNPLVRLLSAAVGIVAVLMIVIGGVQYSSAGSDPQKVAEARKRIANAVFAIFAYIFVFALLNWLVPGGII